MENQSNRIVVLLLRTSAHLNRTGNRITGQFGLNQQQFVVLNEIVTHGPIMQKHLSKVKYIEDRQETNQIGLH
jgi:uncharacterized protein YdgA (DUF945 family)